MVERPEIQPEHDYKQYETAVAYLTLDELRELSNFNGGNRSRFADVVDWPGWDDVFERMRGGSA